MRPRLLVVAGPNGTGKTTVTDAGLAHQWFEDVLLMSNPKFWEKIEASRRDPVTYTMDEIRQHFADKDAKVRSAPPKRAKPPTPRKGKGRKGS